MLIVHESACSNVLFVYLNVLVHFIKLRSILILFWFCFSCFGSWALNSGFSASQAHALPVSYNHCSLSWFWCLLRQDPALYLRLSETCYVHQASFKPGRNPPVSASWEVSMDYLALDFFFFLNFLLYPIYNPLWLWMHSVANAGFELLMLKYGIIGDACSDCRLSTNTFIILAQIPLRVSG